MQKFPKVYNYSTMRESNDTTSYMRQIARDLRATCAQQADTTSCVRQSDTAPAHDRATSLPTRGSLVLGAQSKNSL